MAIHITNRRAEELTREFARMEDVPLSEAVAIAMQEAIAPRGAAEMPRDLVRRILKKHGIVPSLTASQPLPREIYDEMGGDIRDKDE